MQVGVGKKCVDASRAHIVETLAGTVETQYRVAQRLHERTPGEGPGEG